MGRESSISENHAWLCHGPLNTTASVNFLNDISQLQQCVDFKYSTNILLTPGNKADAWWLGTLRRCQWNQKWLKRAFKNGNETATWNWNGTNRKRWSLVKRVWRKFWALFFFPVYLRFLLPFRAITHHILNWITQDQNFLTSALGRPESGRYLPERTQLTDLTPIITCVLHALLSVVLSPLPPK